MIRSGLGAKPDVLRCSRCGRFVDWEHARLQVICECRPHLNLPPVLVREAQEAEREAAMALFQRDFGHTSIVAFGERVKLDDEPLFVAWMKEEVAGALTYRLLSNGVQILALATDPMWQRTGVGGHLVSEVELLARARGLPRIVVVTTNDNLPALYFYQRRGYCIGDIAIGGLLPHIQSPEIVGFGGIPMRDEVRLEKRLESAEDRG